jgi:hypothetical protein
MFAEVEDAVGLDQKHAVAARVAGGVDRADADAAQVEDVTIRVRDGVRTRRPVKLLDDDAPERGVGRGVESRRSPSSRRASGCRAGRARGSATARPGSDGSGDVVLVAVAVDDAIDARHLSGRRDGERRIDDQRLLAPDDEERVSGGVLAPAFAAEHDDVRGELSCLRASGPS